MKLSDRPQHGRAAGAQDPVVRRAVQLLGPKSSGDAPRGGGEGVGSRARVVVGVFHAVAGPETAQSDTARNNQKESDK